jgi:hypothetical protein
LFFDLHTGLGEKNRLHLLTGSTQESRNEGLMSTLIRKEIDSELYELTETHQPGFYRTIGDINTLIPVLAPDAEVLALTMEFATLGATLTAKLDTLERIHLENLGYQSGYTSDSAAQKIREKFRELFAPSDSAWRKNTIRIGRKTLQTILARAQVVTA